MSFDIFMGIGIDVESSYDALSSINAEIIAYRHATDIGCDTNTVHDQLETFILGFRGVGGEVRCSLLLFYLHESNWLNSNVDGIFHYLAKKPSKISSLHSLFSTFQLNVGRSPHTYELKNIDDLRQLIFCLILKFFYNIFLNVLFDM